ncbi:DUF7439 family protein [Streptomyces cinnamoneus]|uniref:DUF7439 family protein n=1 Tax=Streptomyces cinnamoneus TaxID=53446 RepID=UPI000CEEF9C6|nr:hypothetical protein [Streptomyces cinnamoneus]PPT14801.1 hypothetical protein CYQ11_19705 [Streptomyces cinnamoneus]
MSKHQIPGAKPITVLSMLPVRYRTRVGAILALVGVIVSALAVAYADRPEIALAVQVLTALGVVAPDEPDQTE